MFLPRKHPAHHFIFSILILLLFPVNRSFAQNLFVNGSMTGNVGVSVLAPGWELATSFSSLVNTPDLNNTGPVQTSPGYFWNMGLPVNSQDGGTWQNIFGPECFKQTISGLTIGNVYYFSFEYCTQGITHYTTPALPTITIDGATGYSDPTDAGTLFSWQRHTSVVTATSSSVTITVRVLQEFFAYVAVDGFYLSPTPPLPVTLTDFTIAVKNNSAILSWVTAAELNSHHFIIEKSTDGVNWKEAGSLPAAGYSTIKKKYSFTDNSLHQNTYYRLKLYDRDNSFSISKILLARFGNNTETILLYPNPVTSVIKIDLGINAANWNNAEIINSTGMLCRTIKLLPGTQLLSIDVTTLAKGIYFIKLKGNDNSIVNKSFVVQ